ncbi:hypothetical protein M9991_15295 [Chryseobacterium gallinarum]|uniref:hypothetical protein n=1 Tax=Chryseobacterium gallinarum TaxID=1324352 RepID=UPI0020244BA1|nr:hypothetical protein [Chryseobacterium gallinarum]MCL8538235.1 hypothetical protein [Chryseobacterium gallinarum]
MSQKLLSSEQESLVMGWKLEERSWKLLSVVKTDSYYIINFCLKIDKKDEPLFFTTFMTPSSQFPGFKTALF